MKPKVDVNNTVDDAMDASSVCEDDDESVYSGSEAKNSSSAADSNDNADTNEVLAKKETQAVFRLRLLVIGVLLFAAVTVSIIVYYFTKKAENDEVLAQYEGAADKVVESFRGIVTNKFGAISALGVATIAHGVDHARSWPFVALSSFQQRASTARRQSGGLQVSIAPIVHEKNRTEWEEYVLGPDSKWIDEAFRYQEELGTVDFKEDENRRLKDGAFNETLSILVYDDDNKLVPDPGNGPFLPIWQTSPLLRKNELNLNVAKARPYSLRAYETASVVISDFDMAPAGGLRNSNGATKLYSTLMSIAEGEEVKYEGDPIGHVYLPIFNNFQPDRRPVGVMSVTIRWGDYFRGILPSYVQGIDVVLDNSCGSAYTYRIVGEEVFPLGVGDLHDRSFNHMEVHSSFDGIDSIDDGTAAGLKLNKNLCRYHIHVFPSKLFHDGITTNAPAMITAAVALIFVFTAFMFVIYDRLVERRQKLILRKATETSAIVASLFPENVRERLLEASQPDKQMDDLAPKHRLRSYLKGAEAGSDGNRVPIADLFPHTTVLFADIAGFTAWSSTRDPAQVFILLQTVYQAFDTIAKRRKVFKVETIGDSYVAVAGLPEPQPTHAIIMTKFASECCTRLKELTHQLEVRLGPDTGELAMRFGLHSGPVTAGVLRGERARFQLFGDTVNTAARMESTGKRNRIQVSQATADLIISSGRSHWIQPREDAVQAKGKGVLKTFWAIPRNKKDKSVTSAEDTNSSAQVYDDFVTQIASQGLSEADQKQERLIDWITDILADHICQIVAGRGKPGKKNNQEEQNLVHHPSTSSTALDEVVEVISLPRFDAKAVSKSYDPASVNISSLAKEQLRDYVSIIASAYHSNPFHNFEHACHVTMSVSKLLSRIVKPDISMDKFNAIQDGKDLASQIHDYTHGINSDPLTLAAIVFSALIHDVDHQGISNAQLMKEQQDLAELYKHKSVAEQNSLEISWDLLMTPQFAQLRSCMFANQTELMRFRQVIVNVVLATDIFDKELNDLRKKRWDKAFSGQEMSTTDSNDLRATIVIEHIIQASDVSHTMQHWHVYRKWNERLFKEMYLAFKANRMAVDPSTFWCAGELSFFDNYIIPLAKKLKDCNVFGVSSDEYLNYALKNRAEWAVRGEEVLAEMVDKLNSEDED